jgi:hypothetical protein
MTIYETAAHRAEQRAVMVKVADFLGCSGGIELPTLATFDALLRDDRRISGALEVKCRNVRRFQYDDVWVNQHTPWRMRMAFAAHSFDPYMDWLAFACIQWTDALGIIPIDTVAKCKRALRSLSEPRDEYDLGNPVYLVPTDAPDWIIVP